MATDTDDLIEKLKTYEKIKGDMKPTRSKYQASGSGQHGPSTSRSRCTNCGSLTHMFSNCPDKEKRSEMLSLQQFWTFLTKLPQEKYNNCT